MILLPLLGSVMYCISNLNVPLSALNIRGDLFTLQNVPYVSKTGIHQLMHIFLSSLSIECHSLVIDISNDAIRQLSFRHGF